MLISWMLAWEVYLEMGCLWLSRPVLEGDTAVCYISCKLPWVCGCGGVNVGGLCVVVE